MKHITIGEINKFQCIASECPYTCCAGWKVIVDKETDQYYQSVEGPFGKELNENIDRLANPAVIKMSENGRCPFLNEDNLCLIYMELGPEHMCDTCKRYPRISVSAGDLVLNHMTISCPEVGRIFFSRKTPLKLHVIEDDQRRTQFSTPSLDWRYFRLAERAFHLSVEILQNRSFSMIERERIFLLFQQALQNALGAEKINEAEILLQFFSSPENYKSLSHDAPTPVRLAEKIRFLREVCEFFINSKSDASLRKMFDATIQYLQSEQADFDAVASFLTLFNGKEFQREQENLMVYFFFNHYLSDDLLDRNANRNLFHRTAFAMALYQFYRIFTAFFSAQEGKALLKIDLRIMIAAHLSRFFEHGSEKRRDSFKKALEKHQFYDLGYLFQLIS